MSDQGPKIHQMAPAAEPVMPTSPLRRLLIGIALLTFVFAALGLYQIQQTREQSLRQAEIRGMALAEVLQKSLGALFHNTDLTVQTVIDEVIRQSAAGGIREQDLRIFIERQFQRMPELDALRVADARGNVTIGSGRVATVPNNIADREYFNYLRDNPDSGMFISKPLIGKSSKKWVLTCARRITLGDGSFGGVVFGAITIQQFNELLQQAPVSRYGSVSIRRDDLTLITRYSEGYQLKNEQARGTTKVSAGWQKQLADGKRDSGTYTDNSATDSTRRIYNYVRVSPYPLYVNVGLALDEILVEVEDEQHAFLGFMALFLLMSGMMVWQMQRNWHKSRTSEKLLTLNNEQLAQMAHEWQTTFDAITDSVSLIDANQQIIRCNKATAMFCGRSFPEIIGRNCWEVVHGISEPLAECPMTRSLLTGKTETMTFERDGRWLDVIVDPIVGDDGSMSGAVHVVRDVTDTKIMEQTQLFLLKCGNPGQEEFFTALARYLGDTLDMFFVCIDRLLGDGLIAETVAVYVDGKFEDNVSYTLKDTPCGDVVGKTICCFPRDVRGLFPKDDVLQEMMAESYVGTTLWSSQGVPIGLIALIGRQPLHNTELAEAVLKLVAIRASGELERRQAEALLADESAKRVMLVEELKEALDLFALFMKYSPIYSFIKEVNDSESKVLQASDNFIEMIGIPAVEMIGKTMHQIFPSEFADKITRDDQMVVANKQIIRLDEELAGRYYITYKFPIERDNGRKFLAGYTIDITDRKQVELDLESSKALLKTTAEIAQMGGWEIDLASNSLSWTEQVYRIYEVESDFNPTVENTIKFYAPESIPVITNAVQGSINYGESFDLELCLITATGNRKQVKAIGKAEWDKGSVAKVSGTFQDITELRKVENAIAESERRFRTLIKLAPLPLCFVDANGDMRYINDRFIKVFGYTLEDTPNLRDWWPRAYPDESYRQWVMETWGAAVEHAQKEECDITPQEYSITCKDGKVRIIEISGIIIEDSFLATFFDVTERREAEHELSEALSKVQEAQAQVIQQEKLATIGQLAAGIAHEINNPVGFIRSNLASLGKYTDKLITYLNFEKSVVETNLNAEGRTALAAQWKNSKLDFIIEDLPDLIHESQEGAERVKKTVADLMSFARRDTKEEMKPLDLNACMESSISIAWNEIKHVAELKRELGDIPPVKGDMHKLSQVFLNLLVNASHSIGALGVISVRSWHENNEVCVSVTDNGKGISEEVLPHIFEPFFTTKEAGKGTGLGLSISRDIVVKHGGRLDVSSKPGVGTTFTLRLPVFKSKEGGADE